MMETMGSNEVLSSEANGVSRYEMLESTWGNQKWRLTSGIYKIKDKKGNCVPFEPNKPQLELMSEIHGRVIVLKWRQLGITTYYCIFYLDKVLNTPNYSHHIIAQDKETVIKIFKNIIRFAFDNLPQEVRNMYEIRTDKANELSVRLKGIGEGIWSTISVGTSWRWTTVQSLHVTEFGKVCAKFKQKAEEIVTGAINTVSIDWSVVIESTAEGNEGEFFEYCKIAENKKMSGTKLSALDYAFYFFPRYLEAGYRLSNEDIVITQEFQAYFDRLRIEHGIELDVEQQRRYTKMYETQQDKMKREYPSTSKEAFDVAVQGAYYEAEMNILRRQNRICFVPYDPQLKVNTCWDLWGAWGGNDMVIRYFQVFGEEVRWINRDKLNGIGIIEAIETCVKTKWYQYRYHFGPHDLKVHEQTTAKTRFEAAAQAGVVFHVIDSYSGIIADRIAATKRILKKSWFDSTNCTKWFNELGLYRRKRNKTLGMFLDQPDHQYSDNADALGYGALQIEKIFFYKPDDEGPTIITPKYNILGK